MSYPKQPPCPEIPMGAMIKSNLMQALDQNSIQTCMEILKLEPQKVNEKGFNDMTPLHNSCFRGLFEITEVLLEHGGDPNARTAFDETPLHYACRRGNIRIIHALIAAGADVAALDKQGGGCMHFAALGGSVLTMHYLSLQTDLNLDTGNYAGDTPLHISCQHRHTLLIQYLLRNSRSDPLIQNNRGRTALHLAAQHGDAELCWRLLEVGRCRLGAVEDHEGRRPVDVARKEVTERHKRLAEELVFYSTLDPNSPPKGPVSTWYTLLLLPFAWATVTFLLCSHFNSHSGMFAVLMFVVLAVFVARQGHRIHHSSRWPNPAFMGAFTAGIAHCIIAAAFRLLPGLWPCPFTALLVATLVFTCLRSLTYLIFGDSRTDIDPVKQAEQTGRSGSLAVTEIARGIRNENDFCPMTEIIKSERCKYCRLCEKLVQDMDHHCLFLNNCIEKSNHRRFVLFILNVMALQVLFVVESFAFASRLFHFPMWNVVALTRMLFHQQPWVFDLIVLCALSLFWESQLMLAQLVNIARGQTEYYKRQGVRLTRREAMKNIGRFFLNPDRGGISDIRPLLSV